MTIYQYDETPIFQQALQYAYDCLDNLRLLSLHENGVGENTILTGSSGVTFRMVSCLGNSYAIKILIPEPGKTTDIKRYRNIEREVNSIKSRYFHKMEFYENEFHCDGKSYCVIKTDWIDGMTLENYVDINYQCENRISMLACNYCKMALWLNGKHFEHVKLNAGDIIVRHDSSLAIIDYDDIYFPSSGVPAQVCQRERYFKRIYSVLFAELHKRGVVYNNYDSSFASS